MPEIRGVFGRSRELGAVAAFRDGLRSGPSGLLLEGEAGIGKTTLWSAGVAGAAAQMRPAIDYPAYPQNDQGGFCEDTDPQWAWTYSAADGNKALILHPAGHDPCGDRAAILAGTWARTSS